jgi:hypothetical protein
MSRDFRERKLFLSLYRHLANAYPHEFRIVYGEDLDRMGEDAVPCTVAQRRKEIGIRMAPGARQGAGVSVEGRNGAGSGGIDVRLWRRVGPAARFLRLQRDFGEGFRTTWTFTRRCLPENRSSWAPWRCRPVICRRGGPHGSIRQRHCAKTDVAQPARMC